MGCGNEKSYSYCDSKYECENILRQYEEEVWKCFHKTFHSMIQKIASEKDVVSIRKVEDLFQTEYSPEMVAFIQAKIKTDRGYDVKKIKNILYLTCPDMPVKAGKNVIHDKIGYIYSRVKMNPDESMSSPMNKVDSDLAKLVEDFFDLACVTFVDGICKRKGDVGDAEKIRNFKKEVVNQYIEDLFTVNGKKVDSITYAELEDKFKMNPFLFTTGDIRLCGWNILLKK